MRRKIVVFVFILFTSFQSSSYAQSFESKNEKTQLRHLLAKQNTQNATSKIIRKKNKDELKKEIKRRKKFHRYLVSCYNTDFSPEYVGIMQQNSAILKSLRKELRKYD